MKWIAQFVLIFAAIVLNSTYADDRLENLKQQAYTYCTSYGQDAEAIQMIRQEGDQLNVLIAKLADMINEEFPPENHQQTIFLMEVKRVGEWVYAKYPLEWEPTMVGSTYTQECIEHTMASIGIKSPEVAGGMRDQAKKAWEAQNIDH